MLKSEPKTTNEGNLGQKTSEDDGFDNRRITHWEEKTQESIDPVEDKDHFAKL